MKERKYRAVWDDGHDYGEFEYYSIYRNNSIANKLDALKEYRKKYGWNTYRQIEIVNTYLI